MDKRTVLAFALIFLVYFGWMKLYEGMYGKPGRGAVPDSTAVTMLPEDLGVSGTGEPERAGTAGGELGSASRPAEVAGQEAHSSGPAPASSPLEFSPPATRSPSVRVRTPFYECEVNPVGGRIVSWRGLRFKGPDDQPVELVPPDEGLSPPRGDGIVFQRQELDLGSVAYEVVGPSEVVLAAGDPARSVVLRARTAAGAEVVKTFTFDPGRYDIDLQLQLGGAVDAVQQSAGAAVRARFVWLEGIASTEQEQKIEEASFRSFSLVGEDLVFKGRQNLGHPGKVKESFQGSVRYAGVQNKYFLIAGVVPQDPAQPVVGAIHLDGDSQKKQLTWAVEVPFRRADSQGRGDLTARLMLFIGPSEFNLLKSYGVHLEKTKDLGWKIIRPLSELILAVMLWMYHWLPNYGVIIIILSVATKLMFYPLTRSSTRSMKKMQELQPKIKALQEKYKDNREKLSQATMQLYKEEKVNPMAGCLPLLVQMPVFIALYQALRNTIALRRAPFALWMDDLAQPDALFQLPVALPFLGSDFNLLPVLMSLSMYFQSKLTPGAAPGGQMAILNTMMPIMMLVLFYNMPSGLVLYWLINTLMTIFQTWRIHQTAPTTGGAQTS